jgi:hypothetical protein
VADVTSFICAYMPCIIILQLPLSFRAANALPLCHSGSFIDFNLNSTKMSINDERRAWECGKQGRCDSHLQRKHLKNVFSGAAIKRQKKRCSGGGSMQLIIY